MKKNLYFQNLDGLRFLCFLSVFFYHSFHTNIPELNGSGTYHFIKRDVFGNGNIGVNFFFVLSGFLITFLLIEEKKLNGRISIVNFWTRRALRIWPLYFFCVFFGFEIFPLLKQAFNETPNESADPLYYLLFINNFDLINKGLPDASVLGVLWSIAIEEQFYFLWPILLAYIPIKKYWIPFTVIIISTLVFRGLYDDPVIHEHHTLSCIGDMTIGAMGAWLMQNHYIIKSKIEKLSRIDIFSIYVAFFTVYFFRDEFLFSSFVVRIFERSLIGFIILLIILEQNYAEKSFFKMSRFKTITSLGIISYGLYCFHFIGILTTTTITNKFSLNTKLWQLLIMETLAALILTIGISFMSYKFYETPFLKIKERFTSISLKRRITD